MKRLFAIAIMMTLAMGAFAQTKDIAIENALNAEGLKFTQLDTGSYRLGFTLASKRGHKVFLNSETSTYKDITVRSLYSIVAVYPSMPSSRIMMQLLAENGKKKYGSFGLTKIGEQYVVILKFRLPVPINSRTLSDAIWLCADEADSMEGVLTGKDVY